MNFLLDRRITICMLFIALSLLGYVSYKQLPVELLPNAAFPMQFIQVSSIQDMDPNYVESEVIIPLEGAVSSIGGIEKIESVVDSRQSHIQVSFKKSTNLKITSLKLQEKINEVSAILPSGFMVQIHKVDISQITNNFMVLQVRGSGGVDRVRNMLDKEIRPDLENIDGVAAVNVYGGRERAIEIQLNKDACDALNLTPSAISSLLSQNTQEKTFVGFANEPESKYFVHVNSLYTKVSDLENIVVAPGPILLKDVATIFFDMKEETTLGRVNGKDAVAATLVSDSQANLIELSHRTIQAIDQLNEKLLQHDVQIVIQENSAEKMENNISQIINLALQGGILAIFILWFFLKNIRLVLFIGLSIPISVYTAFNLFYAFGVSVNSLTLIGMALAVGMLLDNSVVVLENIYRLSGSGHTPERSVLQGTKEVWRSILAATLTTVTVFLPFVFADNFLIRLIGKHIGVSIISTLFISLLVALLFIPMAAYYILGRKNSNSVFYEKVSVTQRPIQIYLVLLKTCMRNPGVTIIGAIVIFFVTLLLSLTLNLQQMKDIDSDRFDIYVNMQTGSTLDNTDKAVQVMEDRLSDFPELKELICRIQEKDAVLTLVLNEDFRKTGKKEIADIKSEVQRKLANINGAEISLSASRDGRSDGSGMSGMGNFLSLMGIGSNQEHLIIKGSDFEMMQMIAEDIRYHINDQDFIQHTQVSYNSRQSEILLGFDPILLTSYDITRNHIASGLSGLSPELSSGSSFKVGDDTYDIVIRNDIPQTEEALLKKDKTTDDLRRIQIPNAKGGLHRLEDIASINYGRGRSQINRVNQDKQIEVYFNFSRDVTSSKTLLEGYRSEIDQLIAGYNLPAGIAIEVVHEKDDLADFKFLFLAAFILIFMILASVFESFVMPFVLLFSIPLAIIGSLLLLLITGNSILNANTLIGFLILLGVVVNNSIILIDYSNILRKQGYRRNRSLMTAGLSRVRPILITSITTIVAMLPLAMGKSEYAGAIGAPFAITVIGGLAFSALLTLILVPTLCMGLENSLQWYKTLSKQIWIIHLILFLAGIYCIYMYAEGLVWQLIYLVSLILLIPGMTYFAQSSLRRAKTKLIAPDEEIHISVRNLVKIYDWPGKIRRQWNSGIKIRKRLEISNEYHSLKDMVDILWQFGLLAFGIYFTYFYINHKFWIFLLSIAIYAGAIYLWKKIHQYLDHRYTGSKPVKYINTLTLWIIPLLILYELFQKIDNTNLVIAIAVIWLLCVMIYTTSRHIYRHNINVERVKGRLRRVYYRLVKSIPLIGKQHKPFKALKGVSFEIRTGMFGLLGPNGAGKSTLMRIVCGIFNQSYGSVWINGLDTRIYREELQSLIGFLPQEFGTYENMSSWEFLDYQAILKGITDNQLRTERINYVLKAVHMYDRKDEKIASFSGGMKQRIGIALILLHLPRILIVDEPTAGLDPRERIRFRNLLVELSRDRIVIFSTHIIEDISSSCNQVVVVDKGDLKYFGSPANMVDMAAGKVWSFRTDQSAFATTLDKTKIVHHIQDGDTIQVRYLSGEKPFEDAVPAEPNLEDAYLCLLKDMNG